MSGALPTPLGAAPIAASVAITDNPDFLALPASSAVVIIETLYRRTILIATTADARELARKRLAPHDPAQPRSARVDYHALARGGTVHAIPVGSSLEADAVYMHQARARLPHLARVVAERRRAWFVHVDPEEEFPQWTKTNLIGLVGVRSAGNAIGGQALPAGLLLGPLPDKDSAGSFIEKVIDCFDLCRFHTILVQAPRGVACAYKEMGRCPAPCDGSESMAAYRARTLAAARGVSPPTPHIEARKVALKGAAEKQEFERAALIHKELVRLKTLDKPSFAHVRDLKGWRDVLVLPLATKARATVAFFDRGRLWRIGDVDPADPNTIAAVAESLLLASSSRGGPSCDTIVDTESIDTIGLVSRWLFLAKTKRRGVAGQVSDLATLDNATEWLLAAAKGVCKRKPANEPEVESKEIEGVE